MPRQVNGLANITTYGEYSTFRKVWASTNGDKDAVIRFPLLVNKDQVVYIHPDFNGVGETTGFYILQTIVGMFYLENAEADKLVIWLAK